jgi:hypothetical protein
LLPLLWINRKRAASRDDALKELTVAPVLNAILRILLKLERGLIRAGISLPAGGSLLVVARKLV